MQHERGGRRGGPRGGRKGRDGKVRDTRAAQADKQLEVCNMSDLERSFTFAARLITSLSL